MFKSEPICILTAGSTIDGRDISQKVIDDIAETYDPQKYTARINDDHFKWSWKGGSVLSVEKREAALWAVIKPNSHLLRNIENGQLLHTSCEFVEDFAKTGKAYLTGLAFTDEPASLGTTQVHLSVEPSGENKVHVSTGQTINAESQLKQSDDDLSLFQRFTSWLRGEEGELGLQQQDDDMSKTTEELLEASIEQNKVLCGQLEQLMTQLSNEDLEQEPEHEESAKPGKNEAVTALENKVDTLSNSVAELADKFSQLTDEEERLLAGQDGGEARYL